MPKAKVAIVTLVASVLACAVATASASAACTGEEWCINGSPLVGSAFVSSSTVVVENYVMEAPAISMKIECKKQFPSAAEITGPNTGKAKSINFSECSNVGSPRCLLEGTEVKTKEVKFEKIKTVGGKEVEGTLVPAVGTTLANIKLSGVTCVAVGVNVIKGKVREVGVTGQEEKAKQELVVNSGAGELEVGSSAASAKGRGQLGLESGAKVSFH